MARENSQMRLRISYNFNAVSGGFLIILGMFLAYYFNVFLMCCSFILLCNGAEVTRGAIRKFSQLWNITIKRENVSFPFFMVLSLVARVAYENRKLFLITTEGNFSSPSTKR